MSRARFLLLSLSSWLSLALPAPVFGEPLAIQGSGVSHDSPQRGALIRRIRRQRVAPPQQAPRQRGQPRRWVSPEALRHFASISPGSLEHKDFTSSQPLQARLELFAAQAKAAGYEVPTATRRLRGMLEQGKRRRGPQTLQQIVANGSMGNAAPELIREGRVRVHDKVAGLLGSAVTDVEQIIAPGAKVWLETSVKSYGLKRARVSSPQKTFFEVTPKTFPHFIEAFGQNVIWFTVSKDPSHLYTVLADQGPAGRAHAVEYGVKAKEATIRGRRTQYSMPVVLTDAEMDRFIRYTRASSHAESLASDEKFRVLGYFAGGTKVSRITCTNWANSAPIGKLRRWVRQLDRRLIALAARGEISVPELVAQKGLHAALAEVRDGESRREIVEQVLRNSLPRYLRRSARKLLKTFQRELEDKLPESAELMALVDPLLATLPRHSGRELGYAERILLNNAEQGLRGLRRLFVEPGSRSGTMAAKLQEATGSLRKFSSAFRVSDDPGVASMGREAGKIAEQLSRYHTGMDLRPADLVARESLAETLGLRRSETPAKWAYDLLLSKRSPVVAIFNPEHVPAGSDEYQRFGSELELQMKVMGKVGANGHVQATNFKDSHPNSGAIGVVPD